MAAGYLTGLSAYTTQFRCCVAAGDNTMSVCLSQLSQSVARQATCGCAVLFPNLTPMTPLHYIKSPGFGSQNVVYSIYLHPNSPKFIGKFWIHARITCL